MSAQIQAGAKVLEFVTWLCAVWLRLGAGVFYGVKNVSRSLFNQGSRYHFKPALLFRFKAVVGFKNHSN